MSDKEKAQKSLISKSFKEKSATSIENTKDGVQVAQNVKGHGYAEIIEGVPYKEGIE